LQLVEEKTKELVDELGAFRADQFARTGNIRAHFTGTAPEIWEASNGTVTAFCDFVGTGGTFWGCAAYLIPKNVKCIMVEPAGAAVLAGEEVTKPNHRIQGGGYVMKDLPALATKGTDITTLIDGYLKVIDEQAIQVARDLAKFEGATLCVDKSRRKLVSLRVTTYFPVVFFLMRLATSQETIQRSSPQQLSRFR
jgi:cysteine synthase A